jgi:hypothetical protein
MTDAVRRWSFAPTRVALVSLVFALAAPLAEAAPRPTYSPAGAEQTYGVAGGHLLIHYTTSGVDAVPAADTAPANGFPDFVEQVAAIAEEARDQLVALGFRAPVADNLPVGDPRTDIYLRDLQAADGNASSDDNACRTGCAGFVIAENDYAGFSYPTVVEGIRSVVPHEIFHLIQNAYAVGQPASWTEGSAVWAVEQLYGDGNSDFERFLSSFLTKSFRPFERAPAGFGDGYVYGAALWPYFLSHRFEPRAVVDAWQASETAEFLDAADQALSPRGSSFEAAFVEFTRWNLFTNERAAGGGYPKAGAWASVPFEQGTVDTARVFVEGLSARYLPIVVGTKPRVVVRPPSGTRVAAWIVPSDGSLADGVELEEQDGVLSAMVAPGGHTLVVTGLSRNTIATAIDVELTPPDDGDDGGCSAGGGHAGGLALVGVICVARRRRRRARAASS